MAGLNDCQEKQSQDNASFWSWISASAVSWLCFGTGGSRVTLVGGRQRANKSSWHSEELPPSRRDRLYLCSWLVPAGR